MQAELRENILAKGNIMYMTPPLPPPPKRQKVSLQSSMVWKKAIVVYNMVSLPVASIFTLSLNTLNEVIHVEAYRTVSGI